jgi:integrase
VIADYAASKARKRAEHQDRADNSFTKLATEFFREHKAKKRDTRPRRWRDDARLLGLVWPKDTDPNKTAPDITRGSLADTWRDRAVASIDSHTIRTEVKAARRSGIPGLVRHNQGVSENRARKLHSILAVFFRTLLEDGLITVNPSVGLQRPQAPPARQRSLSKSEIRWFWKATEKCPAPFAAAFRLMLLSGARMNEVAGMTRAELSAEGWLLPAARAKNHREVLLPLPPAALDIIAAVPVIENDAGLIFTTNGRSRISGWSKCKRQLDAAMIEIAKAEDPKAVIPPWRIHDLRRTAATGMHSLGILPHIVEACLNHISGARAGVAGTYNVYEYLPEKKEALARWAAHVQGVVADKPGKVTDIAAARQKAKRGVS